MAENAQASLKLDLKKSKECGHFQCLTFDMEKHYLSLGYLQASYFTRDKFSYIILVFIAERNIKDIVMFGWKARQERGAQEVGSCLKKHIKNNLNHNIKYLVLWSDSCGGQKKNIKIVLLLKTIFNSTELDTITLKYLYPGHSFLPNDRNFV